MQTIILFVLCVVCDMSEMCKSKVGDFDNQSTVQYTVGTLQTTVKLQRTFVNVFHALQITTHKKFKYSYHNM